MTPKNNWHWESLVGTGLIKGAAPPPMHFFGEVAKDYIFETTVAMLMKLAPV